MRYTAKQKIALKERKKAKTVEKVLKKLRHEELVNCVESCESTRMLT